MHDPLVVAFAIVRPWPERSGFRASHDPAVRWKIRHHHDHHDGCKPDCPDQPFPWWKPRSYSRFWCLAGRDYYWPALITVWHREPRGRDSGDVCPHYRRWQDEDGQWKTKTLRGWRLHVHHWKIQVHPAQALRRSLLTRCAWCGGRSRKGDQVNVSHSWDGPRSRWWRGEPGLFHHDCSSVEHVHRMCMCPEALFKRPDSGYGDCLLCGRFRPWRYEPDEADRLLASLPEGSRIPAGMRPQLEAAWAARKARAASEP